MANFQQRFILETLQRLEKIETKLNTIDNKISNHLHHHWQFNLILLGGIFGLIGVIIKLLLG